MSNENYQEAASKHAEEHSVRCIVKAVKLLAANVTDAKSLRKFKGDQANSQEKRIYQML